VISYDSSREDLGTKVENAVLELLGKFCRNTEGFGDRLFRWDAFYDTDDIETPLLIIKAIKTTCQSNPNGDLWDLDVTVTLQGGEPVHARLVENALGLAYDLHLKLSTSVLGVESAHFDLPQSKEIEDGILVRTFPFRLRAAHIEPAS
jgi:hypothetical protein